MTLAPVAAKHERHEMPDDGVTVEDVDKLMAEELVQTDAAADAPQSDEEQVAGESEQAAETAGNSDNLEDMDKDELLAVLKEKEAKLAKAEKSYREFRSLSDKHYQSQRSESDVLKGRLEFLERMIASKEQEAGPDPKAQQAFDSEWEAKISENPGKHTIEYFRGVAAELRQDVLNALRQELGGVHTKLREANPLYREQKETIETLMRDGGLDADKALKVAELMKSKLGKTVRQPGSPPAPGRVNGTARHGGSDGGMVYRLEPWERQMLKNTGAFTEKELDKMEREVGSEVLKG